ncbi:MAG: hypothetical protein ACFB22_04025 [Rhodothalassiaceae bacterium]
MRDGSLLTPELDAPAAPQHQPVVAQSPRVMLLLGMAAAAGLGLFLGDPLPRLSADADLARLLCGMAVVKALFAIPVAVAAFWRLGRPAAPALAGLLIAAPAGMAFAAASVWQLSALVLASLVFHTGLISFAVVSLRSADQPKPHRHR